jgi:type IV pilus assembly protein PilQ
MQIRNSFLTALAIIFFILNTKVHADNFSLELEQANLVYAIETIAKFIGINVIISPSVKGLTSIHLQNVAGMEALDLLLNSHGLSKREQGNIWLIAPSDELIKQKEAEIKLHQALEEVTLLQAKIWHIKYSKVQIIAQLLKDEQNGLLSKRGHIRLDERTNSLFIQDMPEQIVIINRWIQSVDVPIKQILIEARLVSLDCDFEQELGIQFFRSQQVENNNNYSLSLIKLGDTSLLDVKLAALEKKGHADLISSPSLFTANQQMASIESGEDVPYQEVSRSGGTAVAFKKAVLGLKVTPQILPDNKILLQLQINQDRPSARTVLGVPVISTRQIVTNILVRNGETAVLGGIYETNQEAAEEGLPWISQIPLIGLLFKDVLLRTNKRKLLIFVTPKVISI